MEWATIWNSFIGMAGALGVLAGAIVAIEKIFHPLKNQLEKRDRRIAQEQRIAESLDKLDQHFRESAARDEQIKEIGKRLDIHRQFIDYHREEHRILWQANRAILRALRNIMPEDDEIRQAQEEMDRYVYDQTQR